MNTLKSALIISAFSIATNALAGMSGNYKVINGECSSLLTNGTLASVQATESRFKVGVHFVNANGVQYTRNAFDYAEGTERKGCLGDCYYLMTGSYSADGTQFTEVIEYARFRDSTPVYLGEVKFTLVGDELEIQDGSETCLLKKVSL